jgi:hypothetical protein
LKIINPVQNKHIPKHASCLQQATAVKNVAKQFSFCPEYKALCLGQIQHITECHSPYFQASGWLHHVMCILVIVKDWGVLQDNK